MKLRSSRIVKGLAFAGCSFTWGQGLWYYSNLSSLQEQELNRYDPYKVYYSHRQFAHLKRFPRLVAQHYDTFEIVRYHNGGSLDAIMDFWQEKAFVAGDERTIGKQNDPAFNAYDPADIEYFVLQCTQWTRTNTTITVGGHSAGPVELWEILSEYQDILKQYLEEKNITLDQFLQTCKHNDVMSYKDLLMHIESLGIKTLIMTWPEELVKFIGNDPWLKERMIKFDYIGDTYNSIEKLISCNPGMTIDTDFQNFEIPPTDNHPSILCHRVIADNIIDSIKERK
jgi:hypothetical protein